MKRFLMTFAAMLLVNIGVFAQSGTLEGDVNNDGVVDVADIVKIIDIMQNTQPQTTYYWYVGTTKPTSLSEIETVSEYQSEVIYTNNSGAKSKIYVVTDTNHNVTFYNPQFNTELGQIDVDVTTIPGCKIYETEGRTGNTGTIKIVIS